MAIQIHTQSREDSNNRAMLAPPTRTTSGVTLRPISLGSLEILRQLNNSLATAEAEYSKFDNGHFVWRQIGDRDNHYLDCEVMHVCGEPFSSSWAGKCEIDRAGDVSTLNAVASQKVEKS